MSSRRTTILMGILLVLLLGLLCRGYFPSPFAGRYLAPPPPMPMPMRTKNSVSGLDVKQDKSGAWIADFDYFYNGEPAFVSLVVDSSAPMTGSDHPNINDAHVPQPLRGAHHVSVKINYPGIEGTTRQVGVTLWDRVNGKALIASQRIDKVIDWPDPVTWSRNQEMAQGSPEQNLARAVALIDSGVQPQLNEAKLIVERLIDANPQLDAGYVELARVAMKSNWGPEGFHQAETLLSSALQIRPDSINAQILLAYVYAQQKRFAKADAIYAGIGQSDTNNLWLWTNWGELLSMEGRVDQATVKYREAIAHPMEHDTYDRAREEAYTRLLTLLKQRNDLDGMEALYKQRISDFGPGSCYSTDYVQFMLQMRGDTQGAIDLARRALNQRCDDSPARQWLGVAEYVKWAAATGPERTESLNQARLFLPAGPMPLYLLATSNRTTPAAKQLVAAGEAIDQKDNSNLTALAYAFQNRDLAAAKRLIALGARPDMSVGHQDVPLALVAVIQNDVETVRLLQQSGVDYSKLRYRGVTALDIAKQSGNSALLQVLGHTGAAL